MSVARSKPIGLILAGGQASRMGGGDKPLLEVGGQSILARILLKLSPQCAAIVISANGDPARFSQFGCAVLADPVEGFAGPLAGVLAGMNWAADSGRPEADILSVSGDCPFLPRDLADKLEAARLAAHAPVACASSGGRAHPVVALWSVTLRQALHDTLVHARAFKVRGFQDAQGGVACEWPDVPFDPFMNVNTPQDLASANAIASQWKQA